MNIIFIKIFGKIKNKLFLQILLSGSIFLIILSAIFINFIRARILDTDEIAMRLEKLTEKKILQPNINPKVVIQRGGKQESGLDTRCLSWSSYPVVSKWEQDSQDNDFVIDYYLPPNKKAIICTTPLLAAALAQDVDKPFVYEVYPTDYGFQVRIILGVSDIQKTCKRLTDNMNCMNWILKRQATVRYEPD
ncbi:MAG: hypothetical protein AAF378_06575 [Cyanobacteria bacterium P01_A01_bin.84]